MGDLNDLYNALLNYNNYRITVQSKVLRILENPLYWRYEIKTYTKISKLLKFNTTQVTNNVPHGCIVHYN